MRADVTGIRNTLYWKFVFDEGDGIYTEKISMVGNKFSCDLPKGQTIEDTHPDHLALIALLVTHPFIHKTLHIPWAVSKRFAKSCEQISKYTVRFDSDDYESYAPKKNARPALAFSGGADSTASLLVMPESTLSVFMDRPLKKKVSMYNKSAAYATIKHAKQSGYDVIKLECDVEYLRQPLGFPTDLVPSIPILALAAAERIDSIAFGTVMESSYRIGHEKARDYQSSHHYRLWGRLFDAAGVPLFLPVSGVSEVGTSIIVFNSTFYPFTRSCIRGKWPKACENCWKCFRKNMLDAQIKGLKIDNDYLHAGLSITEVQKKMSSFPVSHENVLSWALKGSEGNISEMVQNRLEGKNRNLEFLTSFYPKSLDLLPPQYQEETRIRLAEFLKPMDEKHWPSVTSHTMTAWLHSEEAILAKETFDEFIVREFSINSK